MTKVLLIVVVIMLIVLDFAALHDILRGEPNLFAEYAMLVFSAVAIIIIVFLKLKKPDWNL